MVPFEDLIEIQDKSGERDILHFAVSLCSQNPQSSHYLANILSSKWTDCTLSLRNPSYQTWCCHNNHSINPWHTHCLPCVSPWKKHARPLDLFLTLLAQRKLRHQDFIRTRSLDQLLPLTNYNPKSQNPFHNC
jgi:hypothetical protein